MTPQINKLKSELQEKCKQVKELEVRLITPPPHRFFTV